MSISNPVSIALTSSTVANTGVTSSSTSGTLIAANSARKGLTIFNNGTGNLFIDFGSSVTTGTYAVKIASGGYYESPFGYTGAVVGIWDTVNGYAQIREYS